MAGGRRECRAGGLAGGAGRAVRRVPGGAARPGTAGRPGARAAEHGLCRDAGLAGRAVLLHQARSRRRARRAVYQVGRRPGAGARRPDGHRPVRAHHAGRLAAGQGGAAAGLSAIRGRRRGVAAASDRCHHGLAGGRADRPVPLLERGLAARRQDLLLHPQAAAGGGTGRGEPVSPAGLPAPGRRARGRGRAHLRRGPGQDRLLRRLGQPGRAVAGHLGVAGHRAAQRPVDRRPVRIRSRLARSSGDPGGGRRADQRPGRPGRAALRVHRLRSAARPDRGDGPRRPGPGHLARPDQRGSRGGAERIRHPGRARAGPPGPAGRVDQARAQRDHRARPGHRRTD